MHDGMPYDPIQGQGQGHKGLKATKKSRLCRPSVPHGVNFYIIHN